MARLKDWIWRPIAGQGQRPHIVSRVTAVGYVQDDLAVGRPTDGPLAVGVNDEKLLSPASVGKGLVQAKPIAFEPVED